MLTSMLFVLISALVIGMSAAGTVPIVRILPYVRDWVQEAHKPWACDICMSFWSTLLMAGLWSWLGAPFVAAVPAYVVTLAIVRRNSDPIGPPPMPLVDYDAPADETEPTPAPAAERAHLSSWWDRLDPGL